MRALLVGGEPAEQRQVSEMLAGAIEVGVASHEPVADTLAPDVLVALDGAAVARFPFLPPEAARVALVLRYGLDPSEGWLSGEPDLVLAGHEVVRSAFLASGLPAERLDVVGVPAPVGHEPPADRAAARREVGIDPDERVVALRLDAFGLAALDRLLIQLALLSGRPWVLFDVGSDIEAARTLRRVVPHHRLRARMFAEGTLQGRWLGLADAVVGAASPDAFARAAAVGAAYLCPRPATRHALQAPLEAGAIRPFEALPRLAAEVDLLLEPARLAAARAAAAGFATPGAAARIAERVRTAGAERESLVARRMRPDGLPRGLEDLSGGGRGTATPTKGEPDVEAELAALKARLDEG